MGVEPLVHAERVRVLYQRNVISQATVTFNSAIVVVVLWGLARPALLITWAAALWVVAAARLAVGAAYARRRPPPAAAGRWARWFTLGAAANGVLWGLIPLLLGRVTGPVQHLFLAFVLGGMAAGAALSNASHLAALLAFIVPAFLPMLALLFSAGDRPQVAMGILLTVFGVAVTALSRASGRALAEAVRLRFGNAELARGLADLNADLEVRVAERTAALEVARGRERDAERQLASAARLAVVGQLAAGVAHEINSPAAALGANMRFLLDVLRPGEPVPPEALASLADARQLNDRISSYVRRLEDASRVADGQLRIDAAALVSSAVAAAIASPWAQVMSPAAVSIDVAGGLRAGIDREVLAQVVALLLREITRGGAVPGRVEATAPGQSVCLRVSRPRAPGEAAGAHALEPAGPDRAIASGLAAIYGGRLQPTGGEDQLHARVLVPAAGEEETPTRTPSRPLPRR